MPTSHPALAPLTLPAGLRATRAVQALLLLLPDQPAQGWTEGAVEAALHQQGVAVNRVTVYRALDRFCAAGLLQRSVDGQRVTRYWLAAPAAHDQAAPHMECSGCHQPFQLGEGSAAVQAALQALRQALAHSGVRNPTLDVAVQGECAQCAAETSPRFLHHPQGTLHENFDCHRGRSLPAGQPRLGAGTRACGQGPACAGPQPCGASPQLDAHTQEDIERHRGMARAHEQAAQCLASGSKYDDCQKQLQTACKGLALGKNCGMRHAH